MQNDTHGYRALIRSEYLDRRSRSPNFSLRGFAKLIKMSPSRLSELLNGKGSISRKRAEIVADSLGFGRIERQHFLDLVDAENGKSAVRRAAAVARIATNVKTRKQMVKLDQIALVSEWYHFAILEVLKLQHFRFTDSGEIAAKLAIKPLEAEDALHRLLRLGLIVNGNGWLEPASSVIEVGEGVNSRDLRKLHLGLLSKAATAIDQEGVEERCTESLLLAFPSQKRRAAFARIRKFVEEFDNEFGGGGNLDVVGCLTVQFHNITR